MMTPVQSEEMLMDTIEKAEQMDDMFLDAQRLKGEFSEVGAKRLASAIESMLPHFDMSGPDAKVSGEMMEDGGLGSDLMRKLLYIVDAINDAVDDSVLDAEMECDLERIRTDQDLTYLAGKIRRAAADKGFRRWLEEEIEEQQEEQQEEKEAPTMMAEDGAEALFMARM